VLSGAPPRAVVAPEWHGLELKDWLIALLSLAGAVALAAVALLRGTVDQVVRGGAGRSLRGALNFLRGLHSGHIGDYVTWVVVGTVALGAVWAVSIP
jgi:multicomponent Na+:H+ antiporter subunit D